MTTPTIVNEGCTAYVTVSFFDTAGLPAVPSTVTYRIDDLANGGVIRNDTPLTPGASISITLTPEDNAIVNASNSREQRRLTTKATFGAGDARNDELIYFVKNLGGV